MKRFWILCVLLLSGLLVGCRTPAESASERSLRISQIHTQQWRMIVDDWDYLWLEDRSTRLTPWHVDIGN